MLHYRNRLGRRNGDLSPGLQERCVRVCSSEVGMHEKEPKLAGHNIRLELGYGKQAPVGLQASSCLVHPLRLATQGCEQAYPHLGCQQQCRHLCHPGPSALGVYLNPRRI